MKVIFGVDALKMPLTGIGRYTYEIVKVLKNHPDIDDIKYWRGSQITGFDSVPLLQGTLSNDSMLQSKQSKSAYYLYHFKHFLGQSKLVSWLFTLYNQQRNLRSFNGLSSYLLHSPNFYLPPHSGINIATFHDLSIFKCPEFHPKSRVNVLGAAVLSSVKNADFLITDSEFTRQEIIQYFDWPPERIASTHLGVDAIFQPRTPESVNKTLAQYGLSHGHYSLFVSTIEPRKNVEQLINAQEALPLELQKKYPLVLIGGYGWNSEATHAKINQLKKTGTVKYLGYVDESDLAFFYAGARAFFYPSWYEGFGLPVAEAMASGVPVVCSNKTSLPEITQGAALLVEPSQLHDLSAAMQQALTDETWRAFAIENGLSIAKQYQWATTIENTLKIYKTALSLGKK